MFDNQKKITMSCRKAVIHSFYKSGSSRLETCRDDNFLLNSTVRGFTLIELLVVVLIIGILASVALPQYKKAVAKARTAGALSMVKTVADALEVYFLEHGEYPTNMEDLDVVPSTNITARAVGGDPTNPHIYMYSINNGDSYANACSPDLPTLQYTARHREIIEGEGGDGRGKYYCLARWKQNCQEGKNAFAEGICKSMNTSGETKVKADGSIYYRIY